MLTHDEACKLRNSLTAIIGRTQVAEKQVRESWAAGSQIAKIEAILVEAEACSWEMLSVVDEMEREAGITGKAAE